MEGPETAEAFLSGSAASVAAGARMLLTPVQGPTDAETWMDNNPPQDVPWLQFPYWAKYCGEHPCEAQCALAKRKGPKPTKPKSIDSFQAIELINNANSMAFQSLSSSASAMASARNSVDKSALRKKVLELTVGVLRTAVDAAARA
jgi:hypothetical protein